MCQGLSGPASLSCLPGLAGPGLGPQDSGRRWLVVWGRLGPSDLARKVKAASQRREHLNWARVVPGQVGCDTEGGSSMSAGPEGRAETWSPQEGAGLAPWALGGSCHKDLGPGAQSVLTLEVLFSFKEKTIAIRHYFSCCVNSSEQNGTDFRRQITEMACVLERCMLGENQLGLRGRKGKNGGYFV